MTSNIQQEASRCLKEEARAILELIPQLGGGFDRAVNLIYDCRGRLIVTGVGKSGHCGAKIAATLASTGTPSFYVNPLDAYHGDLGMFTPDDVVLAISYSGNTDELLRFIPLLLKRNIPIIGMTGNASSLLAKYSACILNIRVEREADPLNLVPTASTTCTMALGDALACALMKKRQFTPDDFAAYHPGGNLGKRLLARVKDYMVDSNLPVVSPATRVSDTIIEISKTKQGIAVAIDNGKVVGVVTDGDVRRAMKDRREEFFDLTVSEIMSRNPKTISETAMLPEAAKLMRKHNIHSLVVMNADNRFVGIIDAFSCL